METTVRARPAAICVTPSAADRIAAGCGAGALDLLLSDHPRLAHLLSGADDAALAADVAALLEDPGKAFIW